MAHDVRNSMLLMACMAVARAAIAAEPTTASLLNDLADADAAVRGRAGDLLLQRGLAARTEVLAATRSPSPAIAEGAAEVLMQMPWSRPDDPPRVRNQLRDYGRLPPELRLMMLREIAAANATGARIAVRVAGEDPAATIAWSLAHAMARDATFAAEIARLKPNEWTPAWRYALLLGDLQATPEIPLPANRRAAIERTLLDMREAMLIGGPLSLDLQNVLLTDARWRGDHAAALALLRTIGDASRTTRLRQMDSAHHLLMAYHAAHGPLPGLANDLTTIDNPMISALTLARVADRIDAPLLGAIFWQQAEQAVKAADAEEQARLRVMGSAWLIDAGDYRAADRYLAAVDALRLPPENTLFQTALAARYQLGANHNNDTAAIAVLEQWRANGTMERGQRRWEPTAREEELAWRAWRLERDKPGAQTDPKLRARLIAFAGDNFDCAIDLIPWLDANGHAMEAQALFDAYYTTLKAELLESEDPNPLNQFAWFCSQTGRKLDEAETQQKKALAMAPDSAAYLDTMADILARLGRYDQALRLEQIAARFEPGMPFFEEQLFRFRAALQHQK